MLRFLKKFCLPLALLMTSCQGVAAMPSDGWHFLIAPYGWISAMSADLQIRNRSTYVRVPFSEILKDLNFAAQGHFEAGYGRWTLMIDPTYLSVSDKSQLRTIGLRTTSQTTLVDAGVFFRFFTRTLNPTTHVSLEMLEGGRSLNIKNSMTFDRALRVSDSTEMSAPILGLRFKAYLSQKLNFWWRGDFGGFGLNHVRQTWSTTLGMSYAIKKHIDLGLAYRALNIDYHKANSSMNLLLYGPEVGIAFQF